MTAFAEDIDLDFLRQFYDIHEVKSLAGFLQPEHSLCLVHCPEWREFKKREYVDVSRVGGTGGRMRLIAIRGHDRQGLPDEVLAGICGPNDQGYYRQKLDNDLKSSFLFASWKRDRHEFRLVRDRQVITFFPTFDDALAAYFPNGFTPEHSIETKQLPEVNDPESLNFGEGIF